MSLIFYSFIDDTCPVLMSRPNQRSKFMSKIYTPRFSVKEIFSARNTFYAKNMRGFDTERVGQSM